MSGFFCFKIMLFRFENVAYHLPQGFLFQDVSFQVNDLERIAITGKNGAGKSTMLNLIDGNIPASEGEIHRKKELKIGFLSQDLELDASGKIVYDYVSEQHIEISRVQKLLDHANHQVASRTDYESDGYMKLLDDLSDLNHQFEVLGGFQFPEKVSSILEGLGFSEEMVNQQVDDLSGGWKMRVLLAGILINDNDVILLDEPTNHLDIVSIKWLENYLKSFPGAVIIISHDKTFLDNTSTRTIELSNGTIQDYPYHYSKYLVVREEEKERLGQAKKQQDKEIKQTEQLIEKFRYKSSKASFAQSLIKKLEKTDRIEIEEADVSKVNIRFPMGKTSGKLVAEIKDVGKSYDDRPIFQHVDKNIARGEKIVLLGANGTGKTTFLNVLTDKIDYDGSVEYGHNVEIGHFSQTDPENMNPKKTVYEIIDEVAEGEIRKDIRTILGAFQFSGEAVEKKVSMLSGGERTRLALCKLIISPSNFLILDEPTNHLDIATKNMLKDAILNYEGTVMVVSHDRDFLSGWTDKVWYIEDLQLKEMYGGVKSFLDNIDKEALNQQSSKEQDKQAGKVEKTETKEDWKRKKEIKSLKNKVSKLEKDIDAAEQEMKGKDKEIADLNYEDKEKTEELLGNYQKLKSKHEQLLKDWEEAALQLENLT